MSIKDRITIGVLFLCAFAWLWALTGEARKTWEHKKPSNAQRVIRACSIGYHLGALDYVNEIEKLAKEKKITSEVVNRIMQIYNKKRLTYLCINELGLEVKGE